MIVMMEEAGGQNPEEVIHDALNESSDGMNPEELLANLSPMLCVNGGIKSDEDVQDLTELMRETDKLVGRCVYINILKATENCELLEKFIESGGWEVLNDWLQDAKTRENSPFLMELLQVYGNLPVTVGLLKKTNCAKTIKHVSKSGDSQELKSLASDIVEKWMQKIREKAPESSSKDHHDKSEKSRKKKKHKESSSQKESSSNHKKDKEHGKSPEKDPEAVKEDDDVSNDSNDSKASSDITKPSPVEPVKPKAKTVKTVPSKFRSTGLEEETILPAKKKGSGDKAVKRISGPSPKSGEPPEKRPRPTLASLNPTSTPSSSTSPREKGETKIKLIAPRPAPPIESSGFMDALNNTMHMPVRKKRRASSTSSTSEKPKTPTSPTSPNSKQPAVPSFYKDTLETTEEGKDNEEEAKEGNENSPTENDVEMKDEESKPKEEGNSVAGGMVRKKHKKKVSWVEEAYLCQYHYFEMNENERINVNKLKDMEEMKKQEKLMERQATKGMGRGMLDDDVDWRRPPLISGITPAVVAGCNSVEKDVQRQREQGVLQALYFSKDMIPDSAAEADPESVGHQDAVTIPLEDENGPADGVVPPPYPAPVLEPPTPKKQAHRHQDQNFSLPPSVANMIANMAQENQLKPPMNSKMNPMSAAAAIANLDPQVQTLIRSILESGGSLPLENITSDKLMEILKPFENQLGGFNVGDVRPLMQGGGGPMGGGNFMMGGGGPGGPGGPGPGPGGPGFMNGPPGPMGGPPGPMGGPMMGGPMMGGNDGMMGGPNRMGGPGMRFRGGPPQFMGPPRGRGPRGMPPVCRNFASGNCRFGNSCKFLHPGLNGPPL